MGKALGIGGVFFKAKDRDKLGSWYKDTLGFELEPTYGGSSFKHEQAPAGACTVWGPFKEDTDYFEPSTKGFMFNLIVDDLEACLEQVKANGGEIVAEPCEESYGKFAWFLDPEGNKVELWQILNEGKFE
ncbi:VOC family protein [Kangiella sp. TOML190]|uniref:VOC family protein n=1 Tax=Kangiella sp. TOML190 TaxID=2931351 RepID=UPI00203AE39F|nr:VOC family protein [Kangiella sp. TOML190]